MTTCFVTSLPRVFQFLLRCILPCVINLRPLRVINVTPQNLEANSSFFKPIWPYCYYDYRMLNIQKRRLIIRSYKCSYALNAHENAIQLTTQKNSSSYNDPFVDHKIRFEAYPRETCYLCTPFGSTRTTKPSR